MSNLYIYHIFRHCFFLYVRVFNFNNIYFFIFLICIRFLLILFRNLFIFNFLRLYFYLYYRFFDKNIFFYNINDLVFERFNLISMINLLLLNPFFWKYYHIIIWDQYFSKLIHLIRLFSIISELNPQFPPIIISCRIHLSYLYSLWCSYCYH